MLEVTAMVLEQKYVQLKEEKCTVRTYLINTDGVTIHLKIIGEPKWRVGQNSERAW